MKRLSKKETEKMIDELHRAALSPETWDTWYDENGQRDAIVHFAAGEVFNEGIEGYLYAWHLQGKIELEGLTDRNKRGIAVQGLEGMIKVRTTLPTALDVFKMLMPHRCFVEA